MMHVRYKWGNISCLSMALFLVLSIMLVVGASAVFSSALASTVAGKTITTDKLGGNERYLVYVSTDKPVYRENESVYIRAIMLNARDNTPFSNAEMTAVFKIRGPRGDIVFQGRAKSKDSSAGMSWIIPKGTSGGQYTVLVSSPDVGIPESSRGFEIRAYRAPRLNTQIEFSREGYGPGDQVQAIIKTKRAEGGVPVGAKVSVIARVDGAEVHKNSRLIVGSGGVVRAVFSLPDSIDTGNGSVSFTIEDGGVVETASKTLPIILQSLSIAFYPEGGELIAGLANRVYVQANRPDGKPADISGRIVALHKGQQNQTTVSELKTEHEGRGFFTITPQLDINYALILDQPSGISRHFMLPELRTKGTVLSSTKPVFGADDEVSMLIASNANVAPAFVTLHKRELLLDSISVPKNVSLHPGVSISLNAQDSEGVLIVTAWDVVGNPIAERLVYKAPQYKLNVEMRLTEETYTPGSKVTLEILTTNGDGKPVEAVVGLTVTDDAVLELIDKREQAPRLPVMVYLENEVLDLADAHVYLDASNEQAPMAIDLLLGTQGWRRFILQRYETIKNKYGKASERVMAERLPRSPIPLLMRNRVMAMPMAAVQEGNVEVAAIAAKAIEKEQVKFKKLEKPIPVPINAQEEQKILAEVVAPVPRWDMGQDNVSWVLAREYAHQSRANRKANDRADFTETLYWNAGVHTKARDGKATIEFDLSDSVTEFRVMADAFGRNGALGNNDVTIRSVEPFYIEPKMPLDATVGDVINMPVSIVNASKDPLDSVRLVIKGEGVTITQAPTLSLAPGERRRTLISIVADHPGQFSLTLSAAASPYVDTVTRELTIKPRGFPVSVHNGGLLGPQASFDTTIDIPPGTEPASISAIAKIYPSPLANMEEALNALLRQPNGCFEQTSSTNYPLVMAQQYFMSHHGVDPKKITEARALLQAGYKKLIGFESQSNGYEWFGATPAHESLTAYGLMEFVDMAQVMEVDQGMIERTRAWLLSRRDGKGGFKKNTKALDSFGRAPMPTTNAYIVWALLESGESPSKLNVEIQHIKDVALKSDDSYVVALAANILYLSGDTADAVTLSHRLVNSVDDKGAVSKAITSITRSGGDALAIETTSLALLAWLKDDARWAANVETSMKWLFERSQSGRFGSTQSTVLALKAINAYDAARATPRAAGTIQLFINDKPFGARVSFEKDSKGAIELPDFSSALTTGRHNVALRMENGSKMPFSMEVNYATSLPISNAKSAIHLNSHLSTQEVMEGEPLEMNVSVSIGAMDAPTPVAIVGIPAGLEVRHEQLSELMGAQKIDAYEVMGNEVVLYWRALRAGEKRLIPLSLTATIPGVYSGPAGRSYLYYTDEIKFWERGHKITVNALDASMDTH